MRHTPPVAVGLSLVLAAALLGVTQPPGATASCVGPAIALGSTPPAPGSTAERGVVTRGEQVAVSGILFHEGCEDTIAINPGCGVAAPPSDPESPRTAVALRLRQGDRSWLLDTQDASGRADGYAIGWRAVIPADVAAGSAELVAETATLTVTVRR